MKKSPHMIRLRSGLYAPVSESVYFNRRQLRKGRRDVVGRVVNWERLNQAVKEYAERGFYETTKEEQTA